MKAIIKTSFDPQPALVKETYSTLKKRIFDSNTFMEVSTEGQKIIVNKMSIDAVATVADNEISKVAKPK